MKPPKIEKKDYEKVDTLDFVMGSVEGIQYDENHKFNYEGQSKVRAAVRIKFKVDGYKYSHYSRWMGFSYGEKSNLYLKYLVPLVESAKPDMDFDLDALKGMKVRMLWQEKNGFQYIETIRPVGPKVSAGIQVSDDELTSDDSIPF